MKILTVLVLVATLCSSIFGYLIKVQPVPVKNVEVFEPVTSLYEQKSLISLFDNVCEMSNDLNIERLASEFTYNDEEYLNPNVISNLRAYQSKGLLPKGEIFSEYNLDHLNELKIIYELLQNAKNINIFFKAAAWARQNVNCGVYVSAMYMAIQRRWDTKELAIPAPYEILPNYFIQKDAIIKASSILVGENVTLFEGVREEGNSYIIDANYTANIYNNNDDSKLAYFTEDIGLNSYYFLRKLKLAPWFNNSSMYNNYGEEMYQMMKQFMSRYNLERYANGLPEIDNLDWNMPIDNVYDPMLVYSDGNEFPHRSSPLDLPKDENTYLQNMKINIAEVVRHMRQTGYNKTQILNHVMEILVTSDRSYEMLARKRFGKDFGGNRIPSVLEHYMTSLRDPLFWKINKNIVDMVDNALKMLPPYNMNELYFLGVEILNIEIKKLMTAYDYFEFDVTNALKVEGMNSTLNVKIGQPRLNHKPFTVKINISSLVAQKGVIKMYIGPKVLPGEFIKNKNLFTMFDRFEVNIKKGSNVITRNSNDMNHFAEDLLSMNTIMKHVTNAEYGLDSMALQSMQSQFGYPSRLIIPKGSSSGLPLSLFVFVAPLFKVNLAKSVFSESSSLNEAVLSPGYPLDLEFDEKIFYALPNALLKTVIVTHKGDEKEANYGGYGESKKWSGSNNYDPSSRPNYGANKANFNNGPTENKEYQPTFVSQDNNDDKVSLDKSVESISVPRLYMANPPSSGVNSNTPFDYKAKKAQYNSKSYSGAKKDYSQYKSKFDITTKPTVSVGGNDEDILSELLRLTTKDIDSTTFSSKLLGSDVELEENINKMNSATKDIYSKYQVPLRTGEMKNKKVMNLQNKMDTPLEFNERKQKAEEEDNGALPVGLLWFYDPEF